MAGAHYMVVFISSWRKLSLLSKWALQNLGYTERVLGSRPMLGQEELLEKRFGWSLGWWDVPFLPHDLVHWKPDISTQVIAAAGSDEKCKLATQRGAQFSVNYSQGSLKDAVKKLVGSGGVDVAVDMVGGDVFLESLRRCVYCSVQNGQLGLHRTFWQLSLPAWFLSVFAAHVSCRHQHQRE